MWRCVNDFFGYCSKEPDWGKLPMPAYAGDGTKPVDTGSVIGGICKNDPKTCPFYLTHTQVNLNLVAAG